jgi:hypothetical protein
MLSSARQVDAPWAPSHRQGRNSQSTWRHNDRAEVHFTGAALAVRCSPKNNVAYSKATKDVNEPSGFVDLLSNVFLVRKTQDEYIFVVARLFFRGNIACSMLQSLLCKLRNELSGLQWKHSWYFFFFFLSLSLRLPNIPFFFWRVLLE